MSSAIALVPHARKQHTRRVELPVYDKQLDFVLDTETFLLGFVGGVGSGKTRGLTNYVAVKMAYEAGTGTVGGLFANTYKQLAQSTLPELWDTFERLGLRYKDDYVFNEQPPSAWREFRSRFRKSFDGVLSVRRWGQVITRSLDNYASIRGATLGWAAMDEARDTKRDALEVILARVRCPRARKHHVRVSTSPNGYDWVYEEFVEKASADRRLIQVSSDENPFLPEGFTNRLRSIYDAVLVRQEVGGQFVLLNRGLVYPLFERKVHVTDKIDWDRTKGAWVAFDFNRVPFCVVLGQVIDDPAVSGGKVIHALDEVRVIDATTDMACAEVLDRLTKVLPQERSVSIFGDASGMSRSTHSRETDYDIILREFANRLGRHRIVRRWKRQNPPVASRISAVNAMMKNGLGQIRFFMHPRCQYLRQDFERVIYKQGSEQIDKESDKMLTHLSDAVGYMIECDFPVRPFSGGRFQT